MMQLLEYLVVKELNVSMSRFICYVEVFSWAIRWPILLYMTEDARGRHKLNMLAKLKKAEN
jgi:hypothetical protein